MNEEDNGYEDWEKRLVEKCARRAAQINREDLFKETRRDVGDWFIQKFLRGAWKVALGIVLYKIAESKGPSWIKFVANYLLGS